MASQELQMQAIDIESDIEDFFESYQVTNLNEIDPLVSFVSKIEDLKRSYRRIHAQIRALEGENYDTKYPEFEKQVNNLTQNFREANTKLTVLRKIEKDNSNEVQKLRSKLETEKLESEMEAIKNMAEEKKAQCKSERKFFIDQINWDLKNCNWEDSKSDEIQTMISFFDSKLENFYKINSNLEGVCGEEFFKMNFSDENEKIISMIREKISSGQVRLSKLKVEQENILLKKNEEEAEQTKVDEINRMNELELEKQSRTKNLLLCAKNLHYEIKTRYDIFIEKCKIEIDILSDYELLDLRKREENYHMEVRELIDKVSSFEKFVLPCSDATTDLRDEVLEMRNKCTDKLNLFLKKVRSAISIRDVSEKKLKNAIGLKINLSKFKGHNSDVDVYTLRSEFSKLVEPNVQKGLWADYLKKNCLVGQAYNLVSKIEDIDDIWKKLLEVYGNTKLLLHNKISSLGKFTCLEKLKDDEKISNTITSLLNVMTDLAKLAKEYDLEGELYYGGGLQKVTAVIGYTRERKFIKSIVKENLKNDQKWEKLVKYLKVEQKEREAFILNEKSKKCMNIDQKTSDHEKSRNSNLSKLSQGEDKAFIGQANSNSGKCFICGKGENHVCSLDKKGKSVIQYIACKTFVDLKPRDRDRLLYKKGFCSKCLSPGVKWNFDHDCDRTYTCNQIYQKNGKNVKCEKHVLTCGYHASEKSNENLLQTYKKMLLCQMGNFLNLPSKLRFPSFRKHTAMK